MPKRWCVNFDFDKALSHGLSESVWMMQYQYPHGGYDYQGHPGQLAMTTTNWKRVREVNSGDWFVAFVPPSMFFAIRQVTKPRSRKRHTGAAKHTDTVRRTIEEHSHLYLDGVVRYSDAPPFYEDFTDQWTCPGSKRTENQPDVWRYPQRIDVREWEHAVPDGVQVSGLHDAAKFLRTAVFEITDTFFEVVATELRNA
jgi:hypothetical protein